MTNQRRVARAIKAVKRAQKSWERHHAVHSRFVDAWKHLTTDDRNAVSRELGYRVTGDANREWADIGA